MARQKDLTKDRSFFAKYGIRKQKVLNSLCNLLDQKKINYDTLALVILSRQALQSMIYQHRDKRERTEAQKNNWENRGKNSIESW